MDFSALSWPYPGFSKALSTTSHEDVKGDRVRAHSRAALEIAKPYLTEKYEAYRAWGQDTVLPDSDTFDLPFERLLQERFVIGTPDDCLRELLPWRDELGVDHFIFRPFWSGMPVRTALESMDLLSREVIPALRER